MSLRVYQSTAEMYTATLEDLLQNGVKITESVSATSPSSGKAIVELIGLRLVLDQPRHRFLYTPERALNIGFAVGNFLYQLSGRDDVKMIAYYNPLAPRFSDDGEYLHGAYGPRIVQQLERVIAMLRMAPGTRRAVITIFDGRWDHVESKDVPCPVFCQFLIRRGRLSMLTYFRSQNMLMVFPYDIFLFTLIHEWVAAHLNLPLGQYIQFCGSLHLYDDEVNLAERVIQSQPLDFTMPPMTMPTVGEMETVFGAEKACRSYGLQLFETIELPFTTLSPYWAGIVKVLKVFAQARRDGQVAVRDPLVLQHAWDA